MRRHLVVVVLAPLHRHPVQRFTQHRVRTMWVWHCDAFDVAQCDQRGEGFLALVSRFVGSEYNFVAAHSRLRILVEQTREGVQRLDANIFS